MSNKRIILKLTIARQIVPVVKYGSFEEIKAACIQNSYHWPYFKVKSLKTNMRLERLRARLIQKIEEIDQSISEARERGDMHNLQFLSNQRNILIADEEGQREYAAMLLQIGNGNVQDSVRISLNKVDSINYSTTYNYLCDKCFILDDRLENETILDFDTRMRLLKREALQAFYPNGFQSHEMNKKTILAATNKQVDDWNCIVQQLNPNFSSQVNDSRNRQSLQNCRTYSSADKLNAVDDPKDIISQMLNDEMLNKFEN